MTSAAAPLSELTQALIELEQHAHSQGWDQPPALYALVDRGELISREPALAQTLGAEAVNAAATLVPIEQEWSPATDGIEASLAQLAWPATVLGAAIVIERFILPAQAELDVLTEGDDEAVSNAVATHPDRQEVRLAAGVMRDGRQMCAIRMRSRDSDQDVLSGADLLPGLTTALAATLR